MSSTIASLDSPVLRPKDFDRYTGHHNLEILELPQLPLFQEPIPINPKWDAFEMSKWLCQPPPRGPRSQATIKILMIQTHDHSNCKKPGIQSDCDRDLQAKLVVDLLSKTSLPLAAFGAYIEANISFAYMPSGLAYRRDIPEENVRFYCSSILWTITWMFCPTLGHTAAVLFHREGHGDDCRKKSLESIHQLEFYRGHPMLLAHIETKVSLTLTFGRLEDINRQALELEEEGIAAPIRNPILDNIAQKPSSDVERSSEFDIRVLSVLAGELSTICFHLRAFQQQVKFISRCNTRYRLSLDLISDLWEQQCSELDAMLDTIWDLTNIYLFQAESLAERLSILREWVRHNHRELLEQARSGISRSGFKRVSSVAQRFKRHLTIDLERDVRKRPASTPPR